MSEFDFVVAAVLYESPRPLGLSMPSTWTSSFFLAMDIGSKYCVVEPTVSISNNFFKRSNYCGRLLTPNFTSSPLVLLIYPGMPHNATGQHRLSPKMTAGITICSTPKFKLVLRFSSFLSLVLTIAILNRRIPSRFRLPLTYLHTILQLYTLLASTWLSHLF